MRDHELPGNGLANSARGAGDKGDAIVIGDCFGHLILGHGSFSDKMVLTIYRKSPNVKT
jgi:hypothetical protein